MQPGRRTRLGLLATAALLCAACQEPPAERRPGTFSFAVLGDAPYGPVEEIRFRRVIRQLDAADLQVVIHVGDILWHPCSDDLFRDRLDHFQSQRHPLVYTPGDNEWTDCHERIAGSYQPLERLPRLREIFFADPTTSLGGTAIPLTVQAADTAFAEFVENARWSQAGLVFATVHLVGSENGLEQFPGRTAESDAETARRTAAATAWLRAAFAHADSVGAPGIVIAMHAAPGFRAPVDDDYRQAYEPFLETLEEVVEQFGGPVLLVHGDDHEFLVDHPLVRRTTGQVLENFTRMEVFGSPEVGWVEVTVDTAAAEWFSFTPHRVPRWMIW
jgi:hypothetical protein